MYMCTCVHIYTYRINENAFPLELASARKILVIHDSSGVGFFAFSVLFCVSSSLDHVDKRMTRAVARIDKRMTLITLASRARAQNFVVTRNRARGSNTINRISKRGFIRSCEILVAL